MPDPVSWMVIEQGWSMAPHPDLAAAYAALAPEEAPIARYRRFERLSALAPRHRESLPSNWN